MTKTCAKDYLRLPGEESCYSYLKQCYAAISADVGDYPAFKSFGCDTMMPDFFDEVERLAASISALGYAKNDVFSVFLPTLSQGAAAFYALSKLGVIANFIHPLTPPDKLRSLLEDTRSRGVMLLASAYPAFSSVLEDFDVVLCSFSDHTSGAVRDMMLRQENAERSVQPIEKRERLYTFRELADADLPRVPDADKDAKETAVYMHGSGTTGASRTVCLSAYALNSSAWSQYQIDEYHDYGKAYSLAVLPIFHAFGLGAAVHYAMCNAYPPIFMPKFDAVKANEMVASYNVQYIDGAPSMFRKMYEAENFAQDGLAHVNCIYSGGDIVGEAFVDSFNDVLAKHGSKAKLFRGWGLTEMCAVCSTNCHGASRAGSIGKIGAGMKIKVIDEEGNILAPGENGEICLSGMTIMNGYLINGETVLEGTSTDENGVVWVKTGDMGYVDEDGYIFFTGRKKRIILISGYNVYPYSIEQDVMTLPFVREACAVQGYDGDKPLVKLCVVLKEGETDEDAAREKIIEFCKKNMNRFSVPRRVEFLSALPRTKMDKIDFLAMSEFPVT